MPLGWQYSFIKVEVDVVNNLIGNQHAVLEGQVRSEDRGDNSVTIDVTRKSSKFELLFNEQANDAVYLWSPCKEQYKNLFFLTSEILNPGDGIPSASTLTTGSATFHLAWRRCPAE